MFDRGGTWSTISWQKNLINDKNVIVLTFHTEQLFAVFTLVINNVFVVDFVKIFCLTMFDPVTMVRSIVGTMVRHHSQSTDDHGQPWLTMKNHDTMVNTRQG